MTEVYLRESLDAAAALHISRHIHSAASNEMTTIYHAFDRRKSQDELLV